MRPAWLGHTWAQAPGLLVWMSPQPAGAPPSAAIESPPAAMMSSMIHLAAAKMGRAADLNERQGPDDAGADLLAV